MKWPDEFFLKDILDNYSREFAVALGCSKKLIGAVCGNDSCFCQTESQSMHQKYDLELMWKYFEVILNNWEALIKEDLFIKQTLRLQENFLGNFFRSLIQRNRFFFFFLLCVEADLDHNRESLTDELANSRQRQLAGNKL